jgi:formylmethanofuran dehydrogenase subunit B
MKFDLPNREDYAPICVSVERFLRDQKMTDFQVCTVAMGLFTKASKDMPFEAREKLLATLNCVARNTWEEWDGRAKEDQ